MPLPPYCPNCRHPITESDLGWFCRRLRNGRPLGSSNIDEREVEAAYGSGVTTGYVQREAKLCGRYNPPGSSSCSAEECVKSPDGGKKELKLYWHACSVCRMEVPNLEMNVEAKTITVAGPSGAGKTHYIVALHEWWMKNLANLDLMASPAMGRQVIENFKRMRRQVLEQKSALAATVAGEMMSFSWQILPPAFSEGRGLLCTLPDVSGERLLDVNALAENRHFHYSAGVIMLLDGTRIAISHELMDPSQAGQTIDHHEALLAMIQDLRERLTGDEFRALPIAMCVNKVDLLGQLDAEWQELMVDHQANHAGRFDYETCSAKGLAIERLLARHGETGALVRLCKNNFDHVMFFAAATIGSDVKPVRFRPLCVEDPFLWMLWHQGMVM